MPTLKSWPWRCRILADCGCIYATLPKVSLINLHLLYWVIISNLLKCIGTLTTFRTLIFAAAVFYIVMFGHEMWMSFEMILTL